MTLGAAVGSFALLAALLTVIPGLDTAMVLRAAITLGRKYAFATALGINTGALIWGAGAAVGVSALLTASRVAYGVVRIAGAAYMIWLGARLLWSAFRDRGAGPADSTPADPAPRLESVTMWRCWRQGLLTNLLNPKIGAFYVAVLPQFIPAESPHLAVGVLLALVHDLEGMIWFTAIILGVHSLRGWLARRSVQRAVDAMTGTALVGFGLKLGWT